MKRSRIVLGFGLAAALAGPVLAGETGTPAQIERGRYLVVIGNCNDCHTPGYPESNGTTPQSEWLTGNPVGFSGPWGTTYPRNLRLFVQDLTESEWLATVHQPKRPPMPWFTLAQMKDEDLRAVYYFIRSLGAKGVPAPAFVEPGQAVRTPYIDFFPREAPAQQAQADRE
jgi:mono/diheme cytochrome c family protein